MIKLIASDLDGTLLQNGAQSLDPSIFPVIRKLHEKGYTLLPPADGSILICGIYFQK